MKVAFLDRDGVINQEINYLNKIKDFEYTPNCIEGLQCLAELGFKFIIVTNQAGIAKGYYTHTQYGILTDWYLADLTSKGISILDVFHCPHHPQGVVPRYSYECACRKPKAGMLLEAAGKFDIDMELSIMVGDKLSDVAAGRIVGINKLFLVKTGHALPKDIPSDVAVVDDLYRLSCLLES